jgi:hypothetical protein
MWWRAKNYVASMWSYHRYLMGGPDHDWDYGFFYRLVRWKLGKMSATIKNNNIVEDATRISKQIDYACMLMDSLDTTHIRDKHFKPFTEKWGEVSYRRIAERNHDQLGKVSTFRTTFEKAITEDEISQARSEMLEVLGKVEEEQNKTHDRLWRHIGKYVRGWWD